jgi:hypothetical protein
MPMNAQYSRLVGILQPGYLPWLGYFEQMARVDIFVHYEDVQFSKGSWRNRNRIKTPHGPRMLTVPVLTKGKGFPLIKDVRIDNVIPWQKKHLESIRQSYCGALFFEPLFSRLSDIIQKHFVFLLDLNLELIGWITGYLGITTPTACSSALGVDGSGTERLIGIVRRLEGTALYEGAAGRSYIDENLFSDAALSITYQDYEHPEYTQLHGNFIPYLSAVDLLFNHGPGSLSIIVRNLP